MECFVHVADWQSLNQPSALCPYEMGERGWARCTKRKLMTVLQLYATQRFIFPLSRAEHLSLHLPRLLRSTLILCWHQRAGYFPRVLLPELFVHTRYPPCLLRGVIAGVSPIPSPLCWWTAQGRRQLLIKKLLPSTVRPMLCSVCSGPQQNLTVHVVDQFVRGAASCCATATTSVAEELNGDQT